MLHASHAAGFWAERSALIERGFTDRTGQRAPLIGGQRSALIEWGFTSYDRPGERAPLGHRAAGALLPVHCAPSAPNAAAVVVAPTWSRS